MKNIVILLDHGVHRFVSGGIIETEGDGQGVAQQMDMVMRRTLPVDPIHIAAVPLTPIALRDRLYIIVPHFIGQRCITIRFFRGSGNGFKPRH